MEARGPDFFLNGLPVGRFDQPDGPTGSGRYRYDPYRGAGHLRLQEQLRAGTAPRCEYDATGERVSFVVAGCPEPGVLELREFTCGPAGAPGPAEPVASADPARLRAPVTPSCHGGPGS
ncbi:MAG TPA: hypothetical protein VD866_22560 [Urbifossiella sp.]|nr:hypothetical protein [Urbifossiella sp.]